MNEQEGPFPRLIIHLKTDQTDPTFHWPFLTAKQNINWPSKITFPSRTHAAINRCPPGCLAKCAEIRYYNETLTLTLLFNWMKIKVLSQRLKNRREPGWCGRKYQVRREVQKGFLLAFAVCLYSFYFKPVLSF